MLSLADHLARSLAKYQEDEPWETLTETKKLRHQRLGALLAGDLLKQIPSPASTTPPTPSPPSAPPALAGIYLSREAAVEVSVAVPLTVGGVTGALSPKSVQDIFRKCLEEIEKEQKEQAHVQR